MADRNARSGGEVTLSCRVPSAFDQRIRRIMIATNMKKWQVLQRLVNLACESPDSETPDFGQEEDNSCVYYMDREEYTKRTTPIREEIGSSVQTAVFKTCLFKGMGLYEAEHGSQLPDNS